MTACMIHANDHKGDFPESLGQLAADGTITVEMCRSPYDGSGPESIEEVDQLSFYLYRSGLNVKTADDRTVVLAECEIHKGRGCQLRLR